MRRHVGGSLAAWVTALAALVLTGCSGLQGTGDKGYISGDGQVTEYAPADRSEPVALKGELLTGQRLDVRELRGKPVVVNVWWSGCGPCKTEMPMLQSAADQLGDEVAFLGVNIRDNSAANGLAFERGLGVTYPSIYAPDGQALLAFKGAVGPQNIPSTVVLDGEGRVAALIRGEIPSKLTLTQVVECVLTPGGDRCGKKTA